jgi:hypothetical protein
MRAFHFGKIDGILCWTLWPDPIAGMFVKAPRRLAALSVSNYWQGANGRLPQPRVAQK